MGESVFDWANTPNAGKNTIDFAIKFPFSSAEVKEMLDTDEGKMQLLSQGKPVKTNAPVYGLHANRNSLFNTPAVQPEPTKDIKPEAEKAHILAA